MTITEILETGASVIVSLGGGAAIVFGLSNYLGKRWADRALQDQRQEHAKLNLELTHKLGLLTEQTKNALQMSALEHQVRFSKLHEERARESRTCMDALSNSLWLVHATSTSSGR